MTNKCPLTCGWSKYAYAKASCKTAPFDGCECPSGMARINNTCVQPNDCQCKAENGKFYNRNEKILSTDRCRVWWVTNWLLFTGYNKLNGKCFNILIMFAKRIWLKKGFVVNIEDKMSIISQKNINFKRFAISFTQC